MAEHVANVGQIEDGQVACPEQEDEPAVHHGIHSHPPRRNVVAVEIVEPFDGHAVVGDAIHSPAAVGGGRVHRQEEAGDQTGKSEPSEGRPGDGFKSTHIESTDIPGGAHNSAQSQGDEYVDEEREGG